MTKRFNICFFLFVLFLWGNPLSVFGSDIPEELAITNETIAADTTRTANRSISAGPRVTVPSQTNVYFHVLKPSGEIRLQPGFQVEEGAVFRAYLGKVPDNLPEPTGPCPEFVNGVITVSPGQNTTPRNVRIWMSEKADTLDGPLVFYWHGTGSPPDEAIIGLGQETIEAILAEGGIVAAPYHDPAAGEFPWFLTTYPINTQEDDLRVADEILACACEKIGIDTARIHSIGFSAGGLHTALMGFLRSNYIASVATYSGGIRDAASPLPNPNPANRFAAMILHGGPADVVFISFQQASESYRDLLVGEGHFAILCNHGMGHVIPTGARASVWRFFQDHRYEFDPSIYQTALPQGFPEYCSPCLQTPMR
jgi:predicted esterase